MNVLELFSGIGGMHYAFKESGVPGNVVAAVEVNTVANAVYKFNFKETPVLQRNILSLSSNFINKLMPDILLMSPPCQPFTRVGLKKDISDNRSDALLHIISLLPSISMKLKYVLVENVKGFEESQSRTRLIEVLQNAGFQCREFLLSPSHFNIPNSRERYYLLAKRLPFIFPFSNQNELITTFPFSHLEDEVTSKVKQKFIKDVLEFDDPNCTSNEFYLISDRDLQKRAWLLDIVTKDSERSCCFTKAYTHYVEGTGSVYCPYSNTIIKETFQKVESIDKSSTQYLHTLKDLKLRYFTPKEVSRLMCFPETFGFPPGVTDKQKYRLLGNSINVLVVSKLIALMCKDDEEK